MGKEDDPLQSSYIVNCVLNAFSSYTAIMLNILTIHAIRKTSSLPTPLKTLLLSLAISDLGVGLLAQPLEVASMVKHLQLDAENTYDSRLSTSSAFLNDANDIIAALFFYTSFFSIVAVSVDRFLAIHLHLRYQELVTHRRMAFVVILLWILSGILSLAHMHWLPFEISELVGIIISSFCFICTTTVYFKIYFTVRRHANVIQTLQVQQAAQNGEMGSIVRLKKSAISTFYVFLVFLVCYLPEYCSLVVGRIREPNLFLDCFYLYAWTLVYLNSSLNPVIYCWKMRHIRHSIIDILRNIFSRQN